MTQNVKNPFKKKKKKRERETGRITSVFKEQRVFEFFRRLCLCEKDAAAAWFAMEGKKKVNIA